MRLSVSSPRGKKCSNSSDYPKPSNYHRQLDYHYTCRPLVSTNRLIVYTNRLLVCQVYNYTTVALTTNSTAHIRTAQRVLQRGELQSWCSLEVVWVPGSSRSCWPAPLYTTRHGKYSPVIQCTNCQTKMFHMVTYSCERIKYIGTLFHVGICLFPFYYFHLLIELF